MANIFSTVQKGYSSATNTFNQLSAIFIIIGFGALILYYINNGQPNKASDNALTNFKCALTPLGSEIVLDNTALNTNTQLTMINFETEVYKGVAIKNDIPAITSPKMTNWDTVSECISDSSEVVIVQNKDKIRIYPSSILNYHVAINDQFDDLALLISYSPLSGHYQVFNRKLKNEPLVFGVSGYLYRNSDLLFDTRTETLWSQYTGKALVGSLIGASLNKYPFQVLSFSVARSLYPKAQVTSFETGFRRDYGVDPFAEYKENEEIVGPVLYSSDELAKKQKIIGFVLDNQAYAFAHTQYDSTDNVVFTLNNKQISYSNKNGLIKLFDKKKTELAFEYSLWFAWKDFYPETKLIDLAKD